MPKRIVTNKDEMFGVWKVLEPNVINPNTKDKIYMNKPVFSKCICTNCNKTIIYIKNNELKKHSDKSCKQCEQHNYNKQFQPKIGSIFGKLTVIDDGGYKSYRHYSVCKCECGEIITVKDNSLKTGNTTSCGKCSSYSRGEQIIKNILEQNNISFNYDCMFPELVKETGRRLRFDFIIYNNDGSLSHFIEFDGNQHITGMWGGNWSNLETYDVIHERDEIKNNFCKKHNYKLIRIPYSKINSLSLKDIMI